MNDARDPHRFRTFVATLLLAGAATVSIAGCAGVGVDGTYVDVSDSGVYWALVIQGDSVQAIDPYCGPLTADNKQRRAQMFYGPYVLSEDLTRITNPESGDYDTVTWYADKTGFTKDGDDYIRDDSEIGKSAVERWEAACTQSWSDFVAAGPRLE